MVGYVEQILIRRAAFESLRSFHSRRITLLSCVRDSDATATLNHVGAVGGAVAFVGLGGTRGRVG
jgi:hypothetical protein